LYFALGYCRGFGLSSGQMQSPDVSCVGWVSRSDTHQS
jgi:hypothetical protein